jgi:hypothetical protein
LNKEFTMTNFKTVLLTGCALLLAACASTPKPTVRSDVAPGVNFTQFKTWGFLTPDSAQQHGVESLTVLHIQNAVRAQMEQRGFSYAMDNPDLLVNFDVTTRDTPAAKPRTSVGLSYGLNSWGGSGFGIGLGTSFSGKKQVREGTLINDVVGRTQNQLLWSGTIEGQIPADQPTQTVVGNAVDQVFSKFPVNPR